MPLIDHIEALAEHRSVRHATIAIRLHTDEAVDAVYAELGPTVDDSGKALAEQSVRPDWTESDGGGLYWREAVTTVAGVRVILSGPMRVGRRAA